jgi:hypothetical protein
MPKFKITYRAHEGDEEVEADFYKDVDKTWIDFCRYADDPSIDSDRVLRIRADDVQRVEQLGGP